MARALVRWSLTPDADALEQATALDAAAPVEFSAADPDHPDGRIDVSSGERRAVQPGGFYDVESSELRPGTTVELTLASRLRVVASGVADESGEAELVVAIPADLRYGEHALRVLGTEEDGGELDLSTSLDVSNGGLELPLLPLAAGFVVLVVVLGLLLRGTRSGPLPDRPGGPGPGNEVPPPRPTKTLDPWSRLTVTLD